MDAPSSTNLVPFFCYLKREIIKQIQMLNLSITISTLSSFNAAETMDRKRTEIWSFLKEAKDNKIK